MLSRRQLMTSAALGGTVGLAALVRPRTAAAIDLEPMTDRVKSTYALACKAPAAGGGDHAALIADAQAALKKGIASGTVKPDAVQVVVCPICGCRFTVTASASF
jgi:hypothetical protein